MNVDSICNFQGAMKLNHVKFQKAPHSDKSLTCNERIFLENSDGYLPDICIWQLLTLLSSFEVLVSLQDPQN